MIVRLLVGWTTSRPIAPDEHTAMLVLAVDCPTIEDMPAAEREAHEIACEWVMGHAHAQMPTTIRIDEILEV